MRAQTSNNPETPEPQPAPEAPPGNGRDSGGRFAAGNRYGPGNPFARQTAQLRKALLEVVTPQELRQVAFTLLLLAKAGKLEATKLLFQYVLGKPAEGVDPDRLEVEEWKLSQESRVNPVAVHETVNHLPAEAANVLVRHTWPASTQTNYLSAVREELEALDTEDARRAQERVPAEANGADGEGPRSEPQAPDDGGEGREARTATARGGRSARPQAAKGRPGGAPSTNGGDGVNGRHRRSSGASPLPPFPSPTRGEGKGVRAPRQTAETVPAPRRGDTSPRCLKSP